MSVPYRFVLSFALMTLGLLPEANANAVVVVAEGGGFGSESVQTMRSIAATELRAHGIAVLDDTRFEGVTPIESNTMNAAAELGVQQLFVLRLGRLQEKVLMSLEELQVPSQSPAFVARLTASSLDEADIVIPRLVRAVVGREPVEAGARIATVTDEESEPFNKRPGEGLFVVGIGLAPLGGSFGWSYEAQSWRLGVLLQGAESDPGWLGVEGAWIPLDGSISPYVGVGLGIVGAAHDGDGSALGTKLEVGAEFFRLHGVRLFAGVNAIIPFESLRHTDDVSVGVHLRVGF